MKYIVLGIIALMFLKAGWDRIEKWLSATNNSSTAWNLELSFISGEWPLWVIVGVLLVVGFVLLLWSKTPAIAKRVGGYMLTTGAVLAVILMFLGSNALEYRRQQAQALLAGQTTAGTGGSSYTPAVDEAPVLVPMVHQPGQTETVWVPIGAVMVHVTPVNKTGDGSTIYLGCGKVVEPRAQANAREMKGIQIENTTRTDQYKNELRLTEEVRKYLAGEGIRQVRVEFDLQVTARSNASTACPHTRW